MLYAIHICTPNPLILNRYRDTYTNPYRELDKWHFCATVPENRPLYCGLAALYIHFGISFSGGN